VTVSDTGDDGTDEGGSVLFGVSLLFDNAIEQFSAFTEVHDEMDILTIFECALEVGDVDVAFKVVHNLDLSDDIFLVFLASELALGDTLASVWSTFLLAFCKAGGTKLATAQDVLDDVFTFDIL